MIKIAKNLYEYHELMAEMTRKNIIKLLANVTMPTSGAIAIDGKVAPLIKVGAGLIPDLTGRDNIILNTTIPGISRADIAGKFDEKLTPQEILDAPMRRLHLPTQWRLDGVSHSSPVHAPAEIASS